MTELTPKDWETIAEQFDSWYRKKSTKCCDKCGRIISMPEWQEQWRRIKSLVNRRLLKKQSK